MAEAEEIRPRETKSDSAGEHLRESFSRDLVPGGLQGTADRSRGDDPVMKTARQAVELGVVGSLDPINDHERIKSVEDSLGKIGDRVKAGEITAGQAAETYRQVERLILDRADTNLTDSQRQVLSEQVLSHAAEPTKIDQGRYKTCNVTAAEVVAYSRAPEKAAALVADVALKGQFTAAYDNPDQGVVARTVRIDPTPHGESLVHPTPDGRRDHASEIFQVTAVNLAFNASDQDTYRYRQTEPDPDKSWDTGERFEQLDPKTGKYRPYIPGLPEPPDPGNPAETAKAHALAVQYSDGIYMRNFQPNLQPAHMGIAAEIITGKPSPELQGAGQDVYHGDNAQAWQRLVQEVGSAGDLYTILKGAQQSHELPRMIGVNAAKEPFRTEAGITGAGPAWHNITVHGLAERQGQEPRVLISNQWGSNNDHLSWDNGIPISKFYDAVRS